MSVKYRVIGWFIPRLDSYVERRSTDDPHENIIGPNATVFGFVNPFAMPFGEAFLIVFAVLAVAIYLGIKRTVERVTRPIRGLT